MTIYSPSGVALIDAPILKTAKVQNALRSDFCVKLQFNSGEFYNFTKGTYILYKGCKFEIRDMATPESLPDAAGYKYDLTFYGQASRMKDRCIFWLRGTNREATFQDTTTLRQFAQLIADNMNAFLGVTTWCVGIIPEDKEEVMQAVQFDGTKCWDGLYNIADIFGVEAWVNDEIDRVTINFGKLEHGDAITIREGEIVRSIPAKRGYVEGYGNRFYVFGGTKNIPADYYESADGGVTNHVSAKRLHLPDGYDYIDAFEGLAQPFIIEQVVNLDDVFPKNELTITEVNEREVSTDEIKSKIYTIKCSNQIAVKVVETLGLKFTSGGLEGREFGLTRKDDNTFEIVQQSESVGESSIIIPNDYLKPVVGDTFILTGVELPVQNISIAEETLLKRGREWAMEHSSDTDVYSCPTNIAHCMRSRINLELGQRVTLMLHSYGDSGRSSRIQGYEKSLLNEYDATYEIGDNSRYTANGRLSKLESKIYKVATDIRVQYDKGSSATNKIEQITAERDEAYQAWKEEQEKVNEETSIDLDNLIDGYDGLSSWQQGFMGGIPEDTPEGIISAFKLNTDIEIIRIKAEKSYVGNRSVTSIVEFTPLASDNQTILRDANGKVLYVRVEATYEILRDKDGKILKDSNGRILKVRIDDEGYNDYKTYIDAADKYEEELTISLNSVGVPNNTPELEIARVNYYKALDKVQNRININNDVKFLKKVFGEERVLDTYAATLSSLVAVMDEDRDIRAGLYGGGVEELDNIGLKSGEHGALMVFAGAQSLDDVGTSRFRVYEDGTVYQGVARRSKTTITLDNLVDYVSLDIEEEDISISSTLNLLKVGSFIVFDGFNIGVRNDGGQTTIRLPYYDGVEEVNYPQNYGIDDYLSFVGQTIVLRFPKGVDIQRYCFGVFSKNESTGGFAHICLAPQKGDVLILTCDADTIEIDGEDGTPRICTQIGWKMKWLN